MKLYTPSDFLVIGHLENSDDVHGERIGEMYPYIDITPNSYKFLESKDEYLKKNHKIRVYIGSIINDDIDLTLTTGMSPYDRDKKIFTHYENDMFIIRPSYHEDEDGSIDITGKSKCVYIINGASTEYIRNNLFTPIPIFSKNNTFKDINTKEDFDIALGSRSEFGRISTSPWPENKIAYPDGVIWKENENEYYLYTNIIAQRIIINSDNYNKYSEKVSYSVTNDKAKVIYKFDKEDLYNNNFVYQNEIAFIDFHIIKDRSTIPDNDEYDNINNIVKNSNKKKPEGTSLYSPVDAFTPNDDNKDLDDSDTSDVIDVDKTNSDSDTDTNKDTSQVSDKENKKTEDDSSNMADTNKYISNTDFIKKLEHLSYINDPQLFYNHKDLINFHTAMKCNGLVVLAGLSGTGKSALINLYAKALGIDNSRQFKFVPVRPFWNDDSDLLGYVDTVHSIYQPADSGLVNTLVDASNNHDKLYLITFDEMNLARVEYYFSQFLSILEKKPEDRYIQLYNPDLEHRLYNSNKYKAQIPIGSNVLFTGTINLDESTHKFSDKVLDRSNIIKLNLIPFYKDQDYKDVHVSKEVMNHMVDYDNFNHMKDCNDSNKLTIDDLKLLWKIHTILHNANHNLGIGRRIINQINQYLCNLPDSSITHEEALDLQLVQRVFTKVRGSNADIGKILDPNNQDDSNNLIKVLSDSNCSNFTKSIDVLKRKFEEVNNYGFTI